MYYVSPKDDCPHVVDVETIIDEENFIKMDMENSKCTNCEEQIENWKCLICGQLFCSRYINSHFVSHYEQNRSHNICLSMMDLSFWCYDCESYITSNVLKKYYKIISDHKFGNHNVPFNIDNLSLAVDSLNLNSYKITDIKYENLIEGLKSGKFTKISFMTGAGISTTAGIPDFRSTDSGLFKTLQEKYNLSSPEEFFHLSTFKIKPELFYEFSKSFDIDKYKPTPTHVIILFIIKWFMSFLNHKNILNIIYTQNIDSLEIKAKIPNAKIVFAHGNLLESHCSGCNKHIEIQHQQRHIKEGKVLYCSDCNSPCKPKVVLYGENLPSKFLDRLDQLEESDLGIILGSSLKVAPFNQLPYRLDKNCFRLVINRERIGMEVSNKCYGNGNGFRYNDLKSKDLFIEGTTDDIILKIINDVGWKEEFEQYVEYCIYQKY